MYRFDGGLAVPASDQVCLISSREEIGDLDVVVSFCKGHDVAVQAGGNVGLWPNQLSGDFQTVYTFEPDAHNFACLAWNTRMRTNIVRMQAALGDKPGLVGMHVFENNSGAHQVEGPGIIPMITIDSLSLPACDLIYLDIEGHEPQALFGARNTLARFKPVVAIEDKNLCAVPHLRDEALAMLERMGYRQVASLHRDKVFVC
jgi:FkbM family methyltransferase